MPLIFGGWDFVKIRSFVRNVKERVLQQDECLLQDKVQAEYIYFLMSGRLQV